MPLKGQKPFTGRRKGERFTAEWGETQKGEDQGRNTEKGVQGGGDFLKGTLDIGGLCKDG